MKIILETARLLLRELNIGDTQHMFDLNADLEVLKYTGDVPFNSLEEAKSFLMNYSDYQKNGFGRWAVVLKKDQKFIGWCGLKLNEENLIDIGFRFLKQEWNKGYATESANGVLNYGYKKLNLPSIIARVSNENLSSIKVLEKLQMNFWKNDYCEGLGETKYYILTKDEFLKQFLNN